MLRRCATRRIPQAGGAAAAGDHPYGKMLEPFAFHAGKTLVRNRVVMGSMHTGLEEAKEDPHGKMAAFFAERAKGGVGLIVTGGVAPNFEGKVYPGAAKLTTPAEARAYKPVTDAVHEHDGKIIMQILHSGRYAYSPIAVAPSSIPSPIWRFSPSRPIGMPRFWVRKTISDFARCAALAKEAGFDGVEVMGSEGYLINEFIVKHTNKRTDEYGGEYENRIRFPLEILKAVREAVGPEFIVMYRLSMLDLIPNGSTREEINLLAERVAEAGADIINTGIGWHEARIPTIATSVPRAAFTWVTRKTREHLRGKGITIPLVTTNRINTPQVAEDVLRNGDADFVSMARPLLADADFVNKARDNKAHLINVCIGCNQACLDHTFKAKLTSCLVNPVACHETVLKCEPVAEAARKDYVVIGAGPAGVNCAVTLAKRGHRVLLVEKSGTVGGQFNVAKRIPGKEEFQSSIDYWAAAVADQAKNLKLLLNTPWDASLIKTTADSTFPGFAPSGIVLATGCGPKPLDDKTIPGIAGASTVHSYLDVITGKVTVGPRVVVIGAGGIGFDVSVFLTHKHDASITAFTSQWGIDTEWKVPGALAKAQPVGTGREVTMLQRKEGKMGAGLGATTGWIHRLALKHQNVKQYTNCKYERYDQASRTLYTSIGGKNVSFDNVELVMCHGQRSYDELKDSLAALVPNGAAAVYSIGGCKDPSELDAKRAVRQGYELAIKL